jgi:hypothetical protein
MRRKLFFIILISIIGSGINYGQENQSNKKKYLKVGFSARTFNNSDFRSEIGEFLGVEMQGGIYLTNSITSELIFSTFWKKLNSDEKFRYSEVGVMFDYHPADFYIGIGPQLASLEYKYYDNSISGFPQWESFSDYAVGIGGRIGYTIKISKGFGFYGEFKYSKIVIDDDGDKVDVGTFGVSLGFKF